MRIDFSIPGKPQAKGRPRFFRGRAVTPEKTVEYENLVGWSASGAGAKPREDPCRIEVSAYMSIPTKWSKDKTRQAEWGHLKPIVIPDIDNILKIIMDGLNGVAYKDDKQVYSASIIKSYSDEPRVEVTLIYDGM